MTYANTFAHSSIRNNLTSWVNELGYPVQPFERLSSAVRKLQGFALGNLKDLFEPVEFDGILPEELSLNIRIKVALDHI